MPGAPSREPAFANVKHTNTVITPLYAHPIKNKNHHQIYKILPNFTSQITTPFPNMLSLFVCQQNSSQTSKAGL